MTSRKPIGLSYVEKKKKEIDKKEKFYLDEDKKDFIYYYPVFSEQKIDNLIVELMEVIKECKERSLNYLTNDAEILQYCEFLIIKHFTSLSNELEGKTLEVHLETMSKMYDSRMLDMFMNDMFDELEKHRVFDKLNNVEKLAELYIAEINKTMENVQSDVVKKKINTIL